MARIRTIKPEFFRSRSLARCPVDVRMTFAGLWTEADDHGRGVADPRLIKGALWALDDDITHSHVSAHLRMLDETGHIRLYEVGGEAYYEVVKWTEHQAAAYRRGEPRHPAPDTHVRDVSHQDVQESADDTQERAGTGNREQGRDEDPSGKPLSTDLSDFDDPFPIKPSDEPLYLRLRQWSVKAGFKRPEDRAASVQWQWLMGIVGEVLGDGKYSHQVRVTLCGEFVGHVTGQAPEAGAWGHLHRLVKAHTGGLTLSALGHACDWGAGLRPEDQGDPLSLTKYAAAILQRWAEEAA